MPISQNERFLFQNVTERIFWEGLDSGLKKFLIAEAEKYLGFVWAGVPATSYLEFYRSGNRDVNESIMFKKRTALNSLVIAECVEDKGRFLDDIINGIWSICEESTWSVSAHIKGLGRSKELLPDCINDVVLDLFALETGHAIAFANFMLKERLDKITPIISQRMFFELERRVFSPYLSRNDYWWMGFSGGRVNNWAPWCTSSVLISAILTCSDVKRRGLIINKAAKTLDLFLNSYSNDGGCDEGTSYWYRAGGSLIDALHIISEATRKNLGFFDDLKIKNIASFIIRTRISKSYYINFADGSAVIENAQPGLIYNMGELFKDEAFKKEGAYLARLHDNVIRYYPNSSPYRLMLGIKHYSSIKNYEGLPKSEKDVWWQGIEVLLTRECEKYNKGFTLAAKGGHNDESHNHNDVGSIIVFRDDKPIFIDVGVEKYTAKTFSDKRYEIWTMRSSYHNLPIINGFEQQVGEKFSSCETECIIEKDYSLLKLNLKNAYPKEAGIEKWIRSAKLNRKSKRIEITEEFELNYIKELSFVFMCATEPVILSNDTLKIGECSMTISADGQYKIDYEPIKIKDENLKKVWGDVVYRVLINFLKTSKSASISFMIE